MKQWYTSKTLWVNILAVIGTVVVGIWFTPESWAEVSVGALALINIVLRLITGEQITWGPDGNSSE